MMINQYIRTLKIIYQSPKEVVDSFLETNESIYTHPLKFMLLGAIPFLVISTLFVNFSSTSISNDSNVADQLSHWIEISNIRLSTQFLSITLFLSIPLLSLPALFFLREELKGFYSHLILNSYAIGASMLIIHTLIPFWIFLNVPISEPFLHTTLPSISVGLSIILIYIRYFSIQNLMGWIRTLSSFICGYLLYMMVKGLLAGIIGYMIFAVSRLTELSGM